VGVFDYRISYNTLNKGKNMGNLNKVMLIGRIGQDIEKKTTTSGKSVATISIATSEKWTDAQGQKQEKTEWHRVVLWDKLADLVEQYCRKGSQLYVEGSLTTKEWQDKDGNKRYTTEVNGRSIQFLDSANTGQAPPAPAAPEDDIPF